MRKIIAFLQVSVDCFIEGPNKDVDWMIIDDGEDGGRLMKCSILQTP